MADVTLPTGLATTKSTAIDSDGNEVLMVVPTIADTNAPTIAELNAGWDITYFGTEFDTGRDQDNGTDARYTSPQTFQTPGKITDKPVITYVTNPASPVDDIPRRVLVPGKKMYLVRRIGVSHEAPFAADQLVDVYTIMPGACQNQPGAENEKQKIKQTLFTVGETKDFVKISASGA